MYNYLAVVSESEQVPLNDTMYVAAALQKQVARDFSPIWGINATINAFATLEDVPVGYQPIIVMDDIGFAAAGIHLDNDGQPFGLVNANNRWPLTASHEMLEMLADPQGNSLQVARALHPEQDRALYLVEVCDPSEAWEFGYDVNGVRVSDFYTPDYFLPANPGNVRYSFTGAVEHPLQVLRGGYISWLDPATNQWWQQTWFSGDQPTFVPLGALDAANGDFRSQTNSRAMRDRLGLRDQAPPEVVAGIPAGDARLASQEKLLSGHKKSAASKSEAWRNKIATICKDKY